MRRTNVAAPAASRSGRPRQCREPCNESQHHRPLGRHICDDRYRRDTLSRAQGRQSRVGGLDARVPARGELRQHRRSKAARAGQGRRSRRRSRRSDPFRSEELSGRRDDEDQRGERIHRGHDRVDPHVRTAGRSLRRARRGRGHQDARRRQRDQEDAIRRRAGEADRPVPVRQGRVGRSANERRARFPCAHCRLPCWPRRSR